MLSPEHPAFLCLNKTSSLQQEVPLITTGLVVIATLHVVLGTQALFCNIIIYRFYYKKYRQLVPFMYLCICMCDMVTGLAALINSAILVTLVIVQGTGHSEAALTGLIAVYCVLIMYSARVSVYYNVLLAVVRTLSLTRPFRRQKLRNVALCVVIVPVLLIPLVILQTRYFIQHQMTGFMLFTPYLGAKWLGFIGLQLNILIPFLLPSLVVIICMCVQGWALCRSSNVHAHRSENQRNVTITITLLTFLFFVCNSTFAIVFYVDMFTFAVTCLQPGQRFLVGCVLTGTLTMVNAAFNPIIMIIRGKKLRRFVFGRRYSRLNKKSDSSTQSSLQ